MDLVPTAVEEPSIGQINLCDIPLTALRQPTKLQLSQLNRIKVLKSEKCLRDWRGLFEAVGLQKHYYADVEKHEDHTSRILELWGDPINNAERAPNLSELQNILKIIDRWDLVDDSNNSLYEDAKDFLMNKTKIERRKIDNANKCSELVDAVDEDIITIHDSRDHKQFYDAFLLFDDSDVVFAKEILDCLERRGLKICVKDRDILAGIPFQHDPIIRLITLRCRRLVVVISEKFLKSSLNEFLVKFTQALQIEQKKRKIIPCVRDWIDLPINLKYNFVLNYQRANAFCNFWDKLVNAVEVNAHTPIVEARNDSMLCEPDQEHKTDPERIPDISVTKSTPTTEDYQRPAKSSSSECEVMPEEPPLPKKSISLSDLKNGINRLISRTSKAVSASTSNLAPSGKEKKNRTLSLFKRSRKSKHRVSEAL